MLERLKSTAESVRLVVVPHDHKSLIEPTNMMSNEIDLLTKSKLRQSGPHNSVAKSMTKGREPSQSNRRLTTKSMVTSAQLHRPTTSGWRVKKEGMLLKSKRSPGFKKSVSMRYFVLKVEPISKVAELEYYDGKTLKGAMTLQGASVSPGTNGSFILHGLDRTWYVLSLKQIRLVQASIKLNLLLVELLFRYMSPVESDLQESLSWIKAIKTGIERNWEQRHDTRKRTPGASTPISNQPHSEEATLDSTAMGERDSRTIVSQAPLSEVPISKKMAPVYVACPTPIVPPTSSGAAYVGVGPNRIAVAADHISWASTFESGTYCPPEVLTTPENVCFTIDGRCPLVDTMDPRGIAFCVEMTGLNRTSYAGRYTIASDSGRPLCPWGRTGATGRGAFARWGPNHYSTLVLTRKNYGQVEKGSEESAAFEFLVISNGQGWELPQGPVPPSERHTATAARMFKRDLLTQSCCPSDAAARDLVIRVFDEGIDSYVGCLCDARNTDNAWAETTGFDIHDSNGSVFRGCEFTSKAKWITYGDSTITLNPTHALMVEASFALHRDEGAPVSRRARTADAVALRSRALSTRFPSEGDLVALGRDTEASDSTTNVGNPTASSSVEDDGTPRNVDRSTIKNNPDDGENEVAVESDMVSPESINLLPPPSPEILNGGDPSEHASGINTSDEDPNHVDIPGTVISRPPSTEVTMAPVEEIPTPGPLPTDSASEGFFRSSNGVILDLNDVLRQRCKELIQIAMGQAPEIDPDHEHMLYVAIDNYDAEDEDEYSITRGDELLVHRQDEDGWWLVSRIVDGKLGYLPSTFLESIESRIARGKDNDHLFKPTFTSIRA